MPVIDVPQPAFMEEEEIAIFADAVGKFYAQHAPQKRVEKWREDGMVEREFWREAGAAGLLGVSVFMRMKLSESPSFQKLKESGEDNAQAEKRL